jgi:hypothetical protein
MNNHKSNRNSRNMYDPWTQRSLNSKGCEGEFDNL